VFHRVEAEAEAKAEVEVDFKEKVEWKKDKVESRS